MEVIFSIDKSACPLPTSEFIEVSIEQPKKAYLPMEVTEEGMVIDVREVLAKT